LTLLSQRKQQGKQQKIILYKATLYGVLALCTFALVAEILPEILAKMFVIPALILAIMICVIDLFRMNRVAAIAQEEN
jgi:ABC-type antimicrobial peptide transport system permease subunit